MGFIDRWMEKSIRTKARSSASKAAHPVFQRANSKDSMFSFSLLKNFKKSKAKEQLTISDLRSLFIVWAIGTFGLGGLYFVVVEVTFHYYYYYYYFPRPVLITIFW